ncbi:MAG TPA: hypothetical protein EYG80_06410 [Flavobacteriaceae bacterium]|nr:hypothetical protein [Flavobacteriaceae bacterium]
MLFKLLKESLLYYKNLAIQRDDKIWVFGGMHCNHYTGNSKYLFEYTSRNSDIQAIWISNSRKIVDEVQEKGFNAYLSSSTKGIYYLIHAGVAIVTHRGAYSDIGDLPFFRFSKQTKIIQLWHGIGLKKMGFDDTIYSYKVNEHSYNYKIKKVLKNYLFPFLDFVHSPSLIITLSPATQKIFQNAFRVKNDIVKITGYPRNDIFINNMQNKIKKRSSEKIIYMPTFRGNKNDIFNAFLDDKIEIMMINSFLESNDIILEIKLHPFNKISSKTMSYIQSCTNIQFLETENIYEDLHKYSMLLTDYSSIYFDYILLDKPIIFTPFDENYYEENERGFYFSYRSVTPGPLAYSWMDVLKYINLFNQGIDLYKKERITFKNKFHTYQDINSCKRVYDEIQKLL